MKSLRYCLTSMLLVSLLSGYGQQADSSLATLQQLPAKYYTDVNKKLNGIENKLTKKSLKFLAKFQKHEKKLQKKLGTLNTDATNVFAHSSEKYNQLSTKIQSKITKATGGRSEYNAYLDTLSTSLSFLKTFNPVSSATKPMESLANLQGKLQQSEKIKEFVTQRKQQMKDLLSRYTKVPPGLAKEYTKLSKSAYYYTAQLNEYKAMLKDPSKMEQKALSLLTKLPAFQKFMQKNSQLASMFRMPDNAGTPQSLAGLQTRSSVQAIIQQQISAGGPNAQQLMQQNIAQAKSELGKLKDKVAKFGGGSKIGRAHV